MYVIVVCVCVYLPLFCVCVVCVCVCVFFVCVCCVCLFLCVVAGARCELSRCIVSGLQHGQFEEAKRTVGSGANCVTCLVHARCWTSRVDGSVRIEP